MDWSVLIQPFRPPLETVRHYSWWKLRKDVVAGLTVSVVEVPQAMAYAIIAGVPPVYGIYTSIIQGVVGAMLSSSEHMTTGPTNTQSLLIASAATLVVGPQRDPALYLQLVFALAILKGLLQLSFAAARLGDLVRYVSRSVIVGLTAGAGILILVGQLPNFLGVSLESLPRRFVPAFLDIGILGRLDRIIQSLPQINSQAVLLGLLVLAIVLGVRAISRLLPGPLLGVIVSAVLVFVLGWNGTQVPLIGELPRGLPHFHPPIEGLKHARDLLGGALALAVLGMLESVSIAKSIAAHTGERISANQEFFAQGLKNFLTGFFQCIPGSGSFTRSALDYMAGAQTRFAAVFNACFVAAIFFLLRGQARYIPMAALAAVLFVIAFGLIDWRFFFRVARTSRTDALVCLATFCATLLAPLEYAIFIGIFLSIALHLRRIGKLHINEMVPMPDGPFIERPIRDRRGDQRVTFLQVEGDLFFAVADELQDRLNDLLRSPVRVVILRLKRTHSVDATVLSVLEQFAREMRGLDRHVILCGIKPELMRVLRSFGLMEVIGRENLFETGGGIFTSAKRALERARQLVGASIDDAHIDTEEAEEISYSI